MLARVLVMALCPCLSLSVCLLQVGVLSKWLNESSWFWHGSFSPLSYTVLKEIQVSPKIKVLANDKISIYLSRTLDFEKILLPYIDHRNVTSTYLDSVINWTVVCQLS